MYCEKCGLEISSETKFCPGCGSAIEGVEAEKEITMSDKAEDASNSVSEIAEEKMDTEQKQPAKSSEAKQIDNESVDTANAKQNEAAKSENSAIESIKEIILPQKGKNGRVKFKDLPKKKKIIRIAISCGLLLIALIPFISDGIAGANKAGFKKTAEISNEQALAVLYATSIFEGTGYETAVRYGSFRDVSIGEALDQGFENPSVNCENGDNCVYVTISGLFYLTGGAGVGSRISASITYKIDENYNVSVYKDVYNIQQKLLEWAGYLGSR